MTTVNVSSLSGRTVQVSYLGPYTGSGALSIGTVDTDDAVNQYQQSVTIPLTNFSEEITAVTLNSETCAIQSQVIATSVTVDFPGNLATGTYTLSVSGATESATKSIDYTQTHPYTSPVGAVDSNSLFSSPVLITAGTYHRIVSGPSNGTLDAAGAESGSLWANDVADIYTPNEGFTGTDSVQIEVLFDDGTTDTINATITVESPADTTPDQFDLGANVTEAEPGATIQRTFVLAGIDAGETVSVTATGSATVSPSTAQVGDTITVELTAGAYDAVVTGGVSIGGVSDSFSVTSRAAPDITPDPFTVSPLTDQALDVWVEFAPITVTGIDLGEQIAVVVAGTDVEYAVDTGSGYAAFTATSTNVELGYTVKPRIRTSASFGTAKTGSISIGSESSSLSATTRAAVLPTQDVALPDLNLGQSDSVSINLDSYFSGASSYDVQGIPANSGLSFAGTTILIEGNETATAASPITLTVTAFSADGSINDSFSVAIVDDIGPVISLNSLTTLETAPIVSGSAGDATTLTLVVTGVGTYNPTPSGGVWSQQLPTLALGEYPMTLNGQDAVGNLATEASATLSIVEELPGGEGLFRSLFTPQDIELFRNLFR